MSVLSDNNLKKLEAQHRASARIITGCTKSTPIAALMTESDFLLLADQAENVTGRLHKRALRHCQDTTIALAARRSKEITRQGDAGWWTRSQAQRPGKKSSWRETAEDIARRAGIDTGLIELTTLGLPPWIDLSNIYYHSPRHLWISFLPARPSSGINRVSLMIGIVATHMPEFIGCSPAVSTSSSAGDVIGPGTNALQWPSFTISGAGTLPSVNTATTLTRRQSTWCYSVQLTTSSAGHLVRSKVQHGLLTPLGLLGSGRPPPKWE